MAIVVRKRAGQTQLFTREQAAELKAADAAAREREKFLVLAGRLGFDEAKFDRQAAELTARFGSPARLGVLGHQVGCSRLIGGLPPSALWRRSLL